MPQCFGETPVITTWMCSFAAPLDSWRASVSAVIIFGTDSSVTRRSYSFTSMSGTVSSFCRGGAMLHGRNMTRYGPARDPLCQGARRRGRPHRDRGGRLAGGDARADRERIGSFADDPPPARARPGRDL